MKKTLFILTILCSSLKLNSQNLALSAIEDERVKKLTSFKTNYLAELFQAAIDNDILSYSRSNLIFKSTLFGVKKLFDSTVVVDTEYKKYRILRNIELSSKIGMNTETKINEVTPGFKWALINQRDVSDLDKDQLKEIQDSLTLMVRPAFDIFALIGNDTTGKNLSAQQYKDLLRIRKEITTFSAASAKTTQSAKEKTTYLVKQLEENSVLLEKFGLTQAQIDKLSGTSKMLDALVMKRSETLKKGALLTLTGYGRYKDIYWDSASVGFEFVKGLGNKKDEDKPWDFQASAFYNAKLATNLNNQTMSSYAIGKVGINKVLIKNKAGASLMEVLGAAEVNHAFEKPLEGDQTKILADFTLTLRINKTTFLPIEIKYDPKNANVFGYFKLKWDITTDN